MPDTPRDQAANLAKSINGLFRLHPVARAARARTLVDEAKTVLAAIGDAAIGEALETSSYADVAEHLGVSTSAVNKAVSRYRRRAAER